MREAQFPVISLGSEKPEIPDTETLVTWIHSHKGKTADLTTWNIETALSAQKTVSEPCAAGRFYEDRMLHAFGIQNGTLENEFETDFADIAQDISAALKIRKHIRWSVPSIPAITDRYFRDDDTFSEEYAAVFGRFCRFMRDEGIDGHVLCGNADEIMLETCTGRKYIWYCEAKEYEKLLEGGISSLVCKPEDIGLVCSLNDSYDIRKILVCDATREAMESLLETFDPEILFTAGYAPETEQETYFENLSGIKARLSDM